MFVRLLSVSWIQLYRWADSVKGLVRSNLMKTDQEDIGTANDKWLLTAIITVWSSRISCASNCMFPNGLFQFVPALSWWGVHRSMREPATMDLEIVNNIALCTTFYWPILIVCLWHAIHNSHSAVDLIETIATATAVAAGTTNACGSNNFSLRNVQMRSISYCIVNVSHLTKLEYVNLAVLSSNCTLIATKGKWTKSTWGLSLSCYAFFEWNIRTAKLWEATHCKRLRRAKPAISFRQMR